MNDIFIREVVQSFEDVLDDGRSLILIKISLFPQLRLEVSFVAELSDDVAVAVASEYFVAFQHIGVIQLFQDIDFGEEQFFQLFAFEGFELDYLDGHNLI